jgi:hypothetical protein
MCEGVLEVVAVLVSVSDMMFLLWFVIRPATIAARWHEIKSRLSRGEACRALPIKRKTEGPHRGNRLGSLNGPAAALSVPIRVAAWSGTNSIIHRRVRDNLPKTNGGFPNPKHAAVFSSGIAA